MRRYRVSVNGYVAYVYADGARQALERTIQIMDWTQQPGGDVIVRGVSIEVME